MLVCVMSDKIPTFNLCMEYIYCLWTVTMQLYECNTLITQTCPESLRGYSNHGVSVLQASYFNVLGLPIYVINLGLVWFEFFFVKGVCGWCCQWWSYGEGGLCFMYTSICYHYRMQFIYLSFVPLNCLHSNIRY